MEKVTIKSEYLLIKGVLIDLAKIWKGHLSENGIELSFIGGGKAGFYRWDPNEKEDEGYGPPPLSYTWLDVHDFDKLKKYLITNLKPIEIV